MAATVVLVLERGAIAGHGSAGRLGAIVCRLEVRSEKAGGYDGRFVFLDEGPRLLPSPG